ncbi:MULTISPECIES: ETC complex I subunit [unclassified Mesorhizobium]|uniref:ETC complex I subunit n=1 Tax=unclassified Mesorhizobium TaxID=325217 RepID=UPI0015965E3F|nr:MULTISPECIES: ETC complex I subunit [unclassified Mesorhizobium]
MMERQVNGSTIPQQWSLNDNRQMPLSMGRSTFPGDAVARIFKPSRAATTSGTARTRGWRLVFERCNAPFIEPLMGYTGSRDTLTQVELNFPTLEAAVRYAERQGLSYVVQNPTEQADDEATNSRPAKPGRSTYGFSNMTLDRLGLGALQESYGRALDGAANRNDPFGPESWTSPMGVARDPKLTLEAKRSILMNWAWTEYLIDLATNEGMPENNRPSRLDEVEQALLALEREVAADQANSGMRKAA